MRFRDRRDGGGRLVGPVGALGLDDPVLLALPRGGVPVGAEVASGLAVALDVIVARKIGAPNRPELGVGAVAEDGSTVVTERIRRALGIDDAELARLADGVRDEVARRVALYRGSRELPALEGRHVVIVDDGLATGVTADAAVEMVAAAGPSRVVVAVPAGARDTVERLRQRVEVVAVVAPERFGAVGEWYDDFRQTTDDEVLAILAELAPEPPG